MQGAGSWVRRASGGFDRLDRRADCGRSRLHGLWLPGWIPLDRVRRRSRFCDHAVAVAVGATRRDNVSRHVLRCPALPYLSVQEAMGGVDRRRAATPHDRARVAAVRSTSAARPIAVVIHIFECPHMRTKTRRAIDPRATGSLVVRRVRYAGEKFRLQVPPRLVAAIVQLCVGRARVIAVVGDEKRLRSRLVPTPSPLDGRRRRDLAPPLWPPGRSRRPSAGEWDEHSLRARTRTLHCLRSCRRTRPPDRPSTCQPTRRRPWVATPKRRWTYSHIPTVR